MRPYYYSLDLDEIPGRDLDELLALGWYRMHQSIFTCSHVELGELYRVHWLRYSLKEIKTQPSHRRIRKNNNAFHSTIEDFTTIRVDHQELHRRYRESIDFNGAISITDCLFGNDEAPGKNTYNTKCISIFDHDKLIAGGYFDVGENSAASILHFFDPLYSRYSLGKYLILLTIDFLELEGYTLYYPGYIVEGLSKMNYKLFLGKSEAQYFDPETATWKYFQESILVRPQSDPDLAN